MRFIRVFRRKFAERAFFYLSFFDAIWEAVPSKEMRIWDIYSCLTCDVVDLCDFSTHLERYAIEEHAFVGPFLVFFETR